MADSRARLFAGRELRALRARAGLAQAAMADRLGLSVSYLSQLENDERPITTSVADALALSFPLDWFGGDDDAHARRLAAIREALSDPLFARTPAFEGLARAVEHQPELVDRFLAMHAAWRRSEEMRQIADEALLAGEGSRQPWEEVRDWFHAAGNYVDPIDRAAETLSRMVEAEEAVMADRLATLHGIRLTAAGSEGPLSALDRDGGTLAIDRALPPESRRFLIAHRIAALELAEPIEAVTAAADLRSEIARTLLSVGLANYAAGALLMPYGRFREAARDVRHDIDRLRQRFGVSFEQACHRLSTLQRPGARGIPLFFCRIDMAGNVTKRHSATRLQFARFGGACPLWIVHEAVAIPDRILVQLAETPDGVRYVSMAKGLVKPSASYDRPPRRYAVALGCEDVHARDFVYADGLDMGSRAATPIGTSCRQCPRPDCDQRAFPPADRPIAVDPDIRDVVPYRVL